MARFIEDSNAGPVINYVWDTGTLTWIRQTSTAAGGGTEYTEDAAAASDPVGTVPILVRKDTPAATVSTDGDNIAQRGTNYGAAYVTLLDTAGAPVSVGGGTQYTEDAASTADPIGTQLIARRRDSLSTETSTDGDNTAVNSTAKGELYVKHVDALTVSSHAVTNAGTFAVQDSEKIADNAGFTDGATKVLPSGYIYDEVAGTALTENDAAAARIDAKRAQVLVLEDATTRGQRAAVGSTGAVAANVAQLAGTTTSVNSGNKDAGTLRVVLATDQPALTNAQPVSDATRKVALSVTALQVTASGDTTLISSGTRKVHRVEMSNSHASTAVVAGLKVASLNSGAVFGKKYLPAAGGTAVIQFPMGYLQNTSEALTANLSATGQIEYTVYYE